MELSSRSQHGHDTRQVRATSRHVRSHSQAKPASTLVEHDIRLTAESLEDGTRRVTALVLCEQAGGEVSAAGCMRCPRFVRIEVHEAGYTLLCRSLDVRRVDAPFCPQDARPSDERNQS
jgi:hypothetical protein